MYILTWDHFQINPVVKCAEKLLLTTTVHFTVEYADFNIPLNAGKVTPKQFMEISRDTILPWKCLACVQQFELDYSLDLDTLSSPPVATVSDESFSDLYDVQVDNHSETADEEEECGQCGSHLLNFARQVEEHSREDLGVTHLNVCSLRNKIEELKCLQLICKFDVLAITETHLDKSVLDMELQINGMKVLPLDRKERKGCGCVVYYAE